MSTGEEFTCAVKTTGQLYCWGINFSGDVLLINNSRQGTPTQVGTDTDWATVSAGFDHACVVKRAGMLYCWGINRVGQLGLGDNRSRSTPTQVGTDTDWATVSAGFGHTCATKTNGGLHCWGTNLFGQLGLGDSGETTARITPTQVGADTDWATVSTGRDYTCAVKSTGMLYCWGNSLGNSLGNNLGLGASGETTAINIPTQVGTDSDWATVSTGASHTCAVKIIGELFCWGSSFSGQLGLGAIFESNTPAQVGTNAGWTAVSISQEHSCAVRLNGQLYCWGQGRAGQLGLGNLGNNSSVSTPAAVTSLPSQPSSAPDLTSIDLTDAATPPRFNGGVFRVGQAIAPIALANTGGDVRAGGCTISTASDSPTLPAGLRISPVIRDSSVTCQITGLPTTSAAKAEYTIIANNAAGTDATSATVSFAVIIVSPLVADIAAVQTAVAGTEANEIIFTNTGLDVGANGCTVIPALPTGLSAAVYDDGGKMTCAITGTALFWSERRPYTITAATADGESDSATVDIDIAPEPLRLVTQVSLGASYTCAVASDGKLNCWGKNSNGELGLGDANSRNIPFRIGEDADWSTLSTGDNHTCAIKSSGQLYCWGDNNSGQLGIGGSQNNELNAPTQVGSDTDWSTLSTGDNHTCAIKSSGQLYCWGSNNSGQLGIGNSQNNELNAPTQIGRDTDWSTLSTGGHHTCAIKSSGQLYCWGDNSFDQLGIGDSDSARLNSPTQVGGRTDWIAVSAGGGHSCAVNNAGRLLCWGSNIDGQLGIDNSNRQNNRFNSPAPVGSDTDWFTISTGLIHTCAIKTNGELHCWGSNSSHQLGRDNNFGFNTMPPTQVGSDTDWSTISTGLDHTCATKNTGGLYCWGSTTAGALGLGNDFNRFSRSTPTLVSSAPPPPTVAPNLTSVDLADSATPARFNAGVFGAGRIIPPVVFANTGADVRAGGCTIDTAAGSSDLPAGLRLSPVVQNNSVTCQITGIPTAAAAMAEYTIAAVNAIGADTTAATVSLAVAVVSPLVADITALQKFIAGIEAEDIVLTNTGLDVRAGGCAVEPALPAGLNAVVYEDSGLMTCAVTGTPQFWSARRSYTIVATATGGEIDSAIVDIEVAPEPLLQIAQIGLGGSHSCAVSGDGKLNCWGYNRDGQLGLGDSMNRSIPFRVGMDADWSAVSAGNEDGEYTCAIKTNGELYCWGRDYSGQLGIGGVGNGSVRLSPAQVGRDTDWLALGTGRRHICAIKTNGELYCWGENFNGQLGLGDNNSRNAPAQVGADTDWSTISVGYSHTCAIKTNGELYCWGSNFNFELGLGEGNNSNTPIQVGTDTDWFILSAGGSRTCAIKTNGELYCWGNSSSLFDGDDIYNSNTPAQVGIDVDWGSVSTSGPHTCAIKTNGELYCWGENSSNKLGLGGGNSASTPTPTQVGTDTEWAAVSTGSSHTCATKTIGDLHCWGGGAGQLGLGDLGSNQNRSTPGIVTSASPAPTAAPDLTSIDLTDSATSARFNGGVFRAGRFMPPVAFVNAGGDVRANGCTIDTAAGSPDLPAGLYISPTVQDDSVTCQITGLPTVAASMTAYTIAAINAVGTDSTVATVSFAVAVVSPLIASIATVQAPVAGSEADDIVFTNTGLDVAVDSCSVEPALPTGLIATVHDDNGVMTCAISGTPQFWTSRRPYTVTAASADGEIDSAKVVIAVAPEPIRQVAQSSLGSSHTCAITSDGKLNCWGANSIGQLGLGDLNARTIPFRTGIDTDWASVSAGSSHTCAIKTGGELYCWGYDYNGKLGIGNSNFSSRFTPTKVGIDT
ncbi:MAG: hypothetical protein K8963_10110, partial [Proteobacteria bacterium]|nr:hypothetical protein [Pseudomonadota bacterium]